MSVRLRTTADHDEIRTGTITRTPVSPVDAEIRALACAVILRALRDAIPRTYSTPRDKAAKKQKVASALRWVDEAGESFQNWCFLADLNPVEVTRSITECGGGNIPKVYGMQRFRSKTPCGR